MTTLAIINFATMPTWMLVASMLCGMAFLLLGGDRLTVAACSFGASLGLPRSVIDIVVTSVATSVPLVMAAITTVHQGCPDAATSAVIGSVVASLGLFLGIVACVWPGPVEKLVATRDMSILLAAAMLFAFLGYSELTLRRHEGLILVVAGVLFMGYKLYRTYTAENRQAEEAVPEMSPARALAWVVGAIIAIIAGCFILVHTAIIGAALAGFTEIAAGTTVIALGASLPMLSRAVAMGRSGNAGAIAGSVITASIFNLLFASGVAAFAGDLLFMPALFHVELPSLFGVTILLWLLMRTRTTLDRMEGALLIVTYAALMYASLKGSL
jgi:cation:H+ antiporter